MNATVVRVPDALLFHSDLGKSAKILWMVLQLMSGGDATVPRTGLVQARSGLARHTVLRAMAQLRAWGWLPGRSDQGHAAGQGEAHVPADLLLDRRVGLQAKLIYATLLHSPGCQSGHNGQCSYSQLCAQTGVSPNTVKRAVRDLVATGWLEISQRTKFSPIHFLLCNPAASQRQEKLAQVVRRLKAAPFRGEALMRAYLSLLVESDEHDDDASPAFLVNPYTGEELQFDRYYPRVAAFEYNGPQHYGPTERFPDEIEVLKQQTRDYMKNPICAQRGIHLVVVHPEDLTLEQMQQKVKGHLPLRNLAGDGAVIAYLEKVSRSYRQNARDGSLRSA